MAGKDYEKVFTLAVHSVIGPFHCRYELLGKLRIIQNT